MEEAEWQSSRGEAGAKVWAGEGIVRRNAVLNYWGGVVKGSPVIKEPCYSLWKDVASWPMRSPPKQMHRFSCQETGTARKPTQSLE